jgi:hypothetical protein
MTSKIKILFVAANPIDTGPLQLQKEARELQARIRQGPHRDDFEVIHSLAARPEDLLRGLQDTEPHILHFSGHGTYNKEIVLQGDDGSSRPVAPQDLADLVSLFKSNLKLALLSSCFARRQAEALNGVLDFTIGMDKPISDEGAVSYSAAFYQVLASGGSINQAFHAARLVTSVEGRPVFEKSDLLVRPGANADQPFIEVLPSVQLHQSNALEDTDSPRITLKDVSGEIVSIQTGADCKAVNTVMKK